MKTPQRRMARAGVVPVPARNHDPARYSKYDASIKEAARTHSIPEAFVRAVIRVESDYDYRVVSVAGAQGLMQLMPGTAKRMGCKDSFDPHQNIMGGTRYLRHLANLFGGDMVLTIAGYHAGEGAVQKYNGVPPTPPPRATSRRSSSSIITTRRSSPPPEPHLRDVAASPATPSGQLRVANSEWPTPSGTFS